ncbi:MAG: hypothetical protein GTO40_26485, partial [Deltaproteobacteria bacterium]|nr:hypothetical protein [Deltaproteobacteria bacterium]
MVKFLKNQGGRKPSKFDVFTYIDPRDLATATIKAVALSGVGHEAFYIVADDSTANEPLCDLLPRLIPDLGDKAKSLTGQRAGISNEKAKRV